MQQRIAELEQIHAHGEMLEGAFNVLRSKGLIKQVGGQSFEAVESFQESEALRKQIADDELIAKQMEK